MSRLFSALLGDVDPAVIAQGESQLGKVLPKVALIVGLAGLTGTLGQMAFGGSSVPIFLYCHALLITLSIFWVNKPPARPYIATLAVLMYFCVATGVTLYVSRQPSFLIFMGLMSVCAFFFLLDRRFLLASQVFGLLCMAPAIISLWGMETLPPNLLICITAWTCGVALHAGRVSVMQDLETTRQRLSQQIHETERFEEMSLMAHKRESLGAMVGGVAHDFNNLLAGIVGGVDLAQSTAQDDKRHAQALALIRQSSNAATDLCQTLLDYAKGQAPEFQALEMSEAIEEAIRLSRPNFNNGVEIRKDLEPIHIHGDKGQVRQALINLISNAAEAIDAHDGHIDIQCYPLTQAEQSWVVVRVADDGGGIPDHIRGHLFDPFFTTKRHGRGLGLAAVAQAISTHHGEIRVDSADGKTCFELRLPALDNRVIDGNPNERDSSRPNIAGLHPLSLGSILADVFDDLPYLVFYKDTHNRHIRVNRAASELRGEQQGSLDNTHAAQLYPDEAEDYYKDDQEVIASGKPKLGIKEQIEVRPGTKRWFRTDKLPTFAPDGSVSGILVFAQALSDEDSLGGGTPHH
ncbi:MAG: ATP-binding protein [Lysobacterales bacterium]